MTKIEREIIIALYDVKNEIIKRTHVNIDLRNIKVAENNESELIFYNGKIQEGLSIINMLNDKIDKIRGFTYDEKGKQTSDDGELSEDQI